MSETLEDHLRRATRNFTTRLAEDQVIALGCDLARELVRAHAESPPRHPELEPSRILFADGKPRLEGGETGGDDGEDLFLLGALLNSLAAGVAPDVAWRLDGPPAPDVSTIPRRYALATLGSPRRDVRFPTAAAALQALEAALAPAREAEPPWPLFRGDALRAGARSAAAAPTRLEPAWETLAGATIGSPALTASLVLCPTSDGRLLFLDRANGRIVHELRLASAIESSPALSGRLLFVGSDDGELLGVDVVEGRERLRVRLGQMVRSSPLPVGDRVLVGVVEPKGAGGLACVDAQKGKVLWKARLGAVFSSPALAGERVLVGSDDGALHALDLAKGTVAWSHPLGSKVRATPAVAGELAIVADFAGRLAAVRLADGSRAWTAELGHPVYSSACIAAGMAVAGCNEGHVHGVDLATGAVRFELPTRGPVVASAAGVGERFLVGSTDGDVYLIGTGGDVVQRQALTRAGIQSSAAIDGEFACLGSGSGVHALRVAP